MNELTNNRESIIKLYANGPNMLESVLSGLSGKNLDLSEGEEKWTIRQIVHHVVDGDDIWNIFIKRAIGNPNGKFDLDWYWEIPQDDWVVKWSYALRDIEPSLALFHSNRAHIIQLLTHIPESWNHNLYINWPNNELEEATIAEVVDMQANHVVDHINDIKKVRKIHDI